jgi:hypothetical protein
MERPIEEIIGDNEEISEDTEDTVEELTEEPVVLAAIQRPKKERTQKQKDTLEKARETRTRNIAAKKAQKSEPLTVPVAKQKKPKKTTTGNNIRKFVVIGRRGSYSNPA